jgi:nucleotide-binding universal stress UspA family protein
MFTCSIRSSLGGEAVFKHLLVPLDGSSLAESALPAAAYLAQVFAASVTLIHVIEKDAPKEIHKDRHLTEPEEAEVYLKEVAGRAFPGETKVEWHVHVEEVNDVARSIVLHAEELEPDLVVMCTHGRGGVRDWLMGSIAQQVVAAGKTPLLLIPPHDEGLASFSCRLALVALDGVPDHEQALPVAAGLAKVCKAALYLLMVIPTLGTLKAEEAATGKMLPSAMSATLDIAEESGKNYLARHLGRLQSEGTKASAEVARGDALAVIVDTVQRIGADMIVMGTHGKTGMDAFWSGSVTPRLSNRSQVPLLLVRVLDQED